MIAINGYLNNFLQLISRQIHTHNYGKKTLSQRNIVFSKKKEGIS